MNNNKKALLNNTFALFLNQIILYVFPFIVVPYLTRIFTVDTYGRINYAQAIVEYFAMFIAFGFGIFGVREIATNRNNPETVNKIYNTVFFSQLILFCISLLLLIILCCLPKFRNDYYIFLLLFLQQFGIILYSAWFYQGIENMKFITILNLIGHVLEIILTFLLIKSNDDFLLWLILIVLNITFIGIISWFIRKKYFNIKYIAVSLKDIWEKLKGSSQFFLSETAVYFYRQANIVVLGLVQSATIVAYYSTANKLFFAGAGVCYTLTNSLFPYMSKNRDKEFFKKLLLYVSVFGIIISICLFLFAKPVICLIYSDKYLEAVKVLQIFSFAFLFNILEVMLGFPFLGAYGYIKETNACFIFGAVYNTLGLIILYFLGQINLHSVAILAASTCFVMFLHRVYYVLKFKLLK
ncbi:oligosaccharide flippase family protein [bacterium]|nr:oligosaccharide flippase family protein [bacterium]